MLEAKIAADLKTAMLAGDKVRVDALKMLKSALLYRALELGVRDTGLNDQQTIEVLTKEAKKRTDAAEMYRKAGNTEKALSEEAECDLIKQYLPEQMSDSDLEAIVDKAIQASGDASIASMGQIIGVVKVEVKGLADGSRIATMVKRKLTS